MNYIVVTILGNFLRQPYVQTPDVVAITVRHIVQKISKKENHSKE
jgi:hypothetical protein